MIRKFDHSDLLRAEQIVLNDNVIMRKTFQMLNIRASFRGRSTPIKQSIRSTEQFSILMGGQALCGAISLAHVQKPPHETEDLLSRQNDADARKQDAQEGGSLQAPTTMRGTADDADAHSGGSIRAYPRRGVTPATPPAILNKVFHIRIKATGAHFRQTHGLCEPC